MRKTTISTKEYRPQTQTARGKLQIRHFFRAVDCRGLDYREAGEAVHDGVDTATEAAMSDRPDGGDYAESSIFHHINFARIFSVFII